MMIVLMNKLFRISVLWLTSRLKFDKLLVLLVRAQRREDGPVQAEALHDWGFLARDVREGDACPPRRLEILIFRRRSFALVMLGVNLHTCKDDSYCEQSV